jgi:type IV pilus assembly protein PilP
MIMGAKKIAWLIIPLCVGGSLSAQEKIETPSHKSKEAVDKLKAAPSAVGKTLKDLGKSLSAKLGSGQGEMKTVKTNSEAVSVPEAEKKAEEAQLAVPPALSKRDPFRPFTLNNRTTRPPRENLTPLERFELGQLKLVGVIVDVKQPNALVEDPLGFGYKISVGTPIGVNEGKVKSIQPAGLVIEEFQFDVYGARKKVERSMKLVPEKAE